MDKKKVQEAIKQIDDALAQIASNRQGHAALANSIQLVSRCCETFFNDREAAHEKLIRESLPEHLEKNDGRTDEPTERPEPRDENSEGSGDSV